jgi:hypothetical protein
MAQQVATSAVLQCSFGAAPSTYVGTPGTILTESKPPGNILGFAPISNIPPFGMCSSPANPTVAAATAAALGVLTPMPCVPVTTPWVPGVPTVLMGTAPTIDNNCKCMCAWGGIISVNMAGTTIVDVP